MVRLSVAKIVVVLGMLFSFTMFSAHAATSQDVYGQWITPDRDAIIMIHNCEGSLCADLVSHAYAQTTQKDIKNPDPALKSRPLLGVRILQGLKMAGRKKWRNGQLYDPRTGKTYGSHVKIIDPNHLKITGCIGPGLCKGYIWERASINKSAILRGATGQESP